MTDQIAQKIKEMRVAQGLTLKDLSDKTGLSISFLSQAERGLTSVGIASLQKIAEGLGVELACFFTLPERRKKRVMRSYEQEVFRLEQSDFIYSSLAGDIEDRMLEPLVVTLLPGQTREGLLPFSHKGEEFGYVLEGVLTMLIEDKEYQLHPGDSFHIPSAIPHNWGNFTNRLVKSLVVITPRIL